MHLISLKIATKTLLQVEAASTVAGASDDEEDIEIPAEIEEVIGILTLNPHLHVFSYFFFSFPVTK